jgi:hypothetical protein
MGLPLARQVSIQAALAICTSRNASSGVRPKAEQDFRFIHFLVAAAIVSGEIQLP